MPSTPDVLPRRIVLSVAGLCVLPSLLRLLGVPFAFTDESRGMMVHILLEWTAFCVALISVHFSLLHFSLRGDATTAIIGTALFFSGTMDGFHALAVGGLIYSVSDYADFIPFTWSISRIVNALLIVGGARLALRRPPASTVLGRQRDSWFVGMVALMFGLGACSIIQACALAPRLPHIIHPDAAIPRPWDAVALVLFLLAGGLVLPRLTRERPSLFAYGLLLSMLPQIAAQCHAAFGSRSLFDGHAHIASALKILAYQVPFYGLMLDYRRAYHSEASLQSAQEKLKIAREVQQGILPSEAPPLPGFDIAGVSRPADVMGGDFFDYMSLGDGEWAILVADVSGHDVGASALMAQSRAFLRATVHATNDPGVALTAANRFVCDDVKEHRFCSVLYAAIDPSRRRIRYAGAGHNAWILDASDEAVELPNTGPALGMIPGVRIPCGKEFELRPGSALVVVTDGIFEAESLGGVPFGVDRLLDAVRAQRQRPASEIVETILSAVAQHTGHSPQNDDLTVVVVRSLPTENGIEREKP